MLLCRFSSLRFGCSVCSWVWWCSDDVLICVLIGNVFSEVYRLEMNLLVGLCWVSIVGSVKGVFSFIGIFFSECMV